MDVKINGKNINNIYSAEVINYFESPLEAEVKNILKNNRAKKKKLSVFISYSHLDEDIKEKLDAHLATLKILERISSWDDRKIIPGENWDNRIRAELASADMILLLISANFINSRYIWEVELSRAIAKSETGDVIVIPIFCKACDYKGLPFEKFQGLPKNAIPIASSVDIDEALTQVSTGIRMVIDEMFSGA